MFVGFKTLPLDVVERSKMAGRTRHTNLSYYIYSRRSKRKGELLIEEDIFFSGTAQKGLAEVETGKEIA